MNRAFGLRVALFLVVVGASTVCAAGQQQLVLITSVDELVQYPAGSVAISSKLHVIVLPGTEQAVLLRSITDAEYRSSQVQAIGAQMIDHQLLAAAFVVPVVVEQDVPLLSDELFHFLKETVNRISGFTVFSDVVAPVPQEGTDP